jgi:hypothetical protein
VSPRRWPKSGPTAGARLTKKREKAKKATLGQAPELGEPKLSRGIGLAFRSLKRPLSSQGTALRDAF